MGISTVGLAQAVNNTAHKTNTMNDLCMKYFSLLSSFLLLPTHPVYLPILIFIDQLQMGQFLQILDGSQVLVLVGRVPEDVTTIFYSEAVLITGYLVFSFRFTNPLTFFATRKADLACSTLTETPG